MRKEERIGEMFSFLGAMIWGIFPIITILSYKIVPPLISLSVSTFLSSIFFLIIVLYRGKIQEFRNLLLWKYVFGVVIFIGVLFYFFYYFGLAKTTPGNVSIIGLFEVFTSYVLFHIIRKEPFSLESKIGAVLMIFGATIVLAPNFSDFNFGDLFILISTFCGPLGNLFQQKAKKIASTETILFLRSIMATPFLLFLAYFFGQHLEISQIKESFLFFNF